MSPINLRRWQNFKDNRRGFYALWIFLAVFGLSLCAEFVANDRPIIVSYKGELLMPVFVDYPEEKFGGFLAVTDYRDPVISDEIALNGWTIWPPVRYNYRTVNNEMPNAAPTKPAFLYSRAQLCQAYTKGLDDPMCRMGNFNLIGTDDQGRDLLARVIYGFRVSVLFGLFLTIGSALVGITLGAMQGYFGGWTDLIVQRIVEIWSSQPQLYILLIMAGLFPTGFWMLLFILLLFAWTGFVGIVRAEFLRARNFEYVNAARALGVSNLTIMWRHLLPNAMVSTLTFLPFILSGAITTLTSLDFLGLGLPPGSASLGEILKQGKSNLQAPWIGLTGFVTMSVMLSLLVFIGEAVRDAFDPRKIFR
jgi:microcin C transport system permease protein